MARKTGRGGDAAAMEGRRTMVARGLLRRLSVRQIGMWLATLPEEERPADCSVATIFRDAQEVRREWKRERMELLDALLDEDLARLNELERALWDQAVAGRESAVDRCLAIQRQRAELVRPERTKEGGRDAGLRLPGVPAEGAMRLVVEYVDDWREELRRGGSDGGGYSEGYGGYDGGDSYGDAGGGNAGDGRDGGDAGGGKQRERGE
jgi:hypothetical protein